MKLGGLSTYCILLSVYTAVKQISLTKLAHSHKHIKKSESDLVTTIRAELKSCERKSERGFDVLLFKLRDGWSKGSGIRHSCDLLYGEELVMPRSDMRYFTILIYGKFNIHQYLHIFHNTCMCK